MAAQWVAAVLAPKVRGAWLLHQRSRERVLDFFVMFSSMAALFGAADALRASTAPFQRVYFEPHLAAAYGILIMLLSLLSTALFLVMLPARTEQAA